MQLKRLRYIGEMSTGYDEIDPKAAHELNVLVTELQLSPSPQG